MKQRKPTSLFLPLLWFIAAGLWGATFFRSLANGNTSWTHAAVAAACLILGIVNLRRFLRDRR